MLWFNIPNTLPDISDELEKLLPYAQTYPGFNNGLIAIPLTRRPGIPRDITAKSDGTETEICPYVTPKLRHFIQTAFKIKTWYYTITILNPSGNVGTNQTESLTKDTRTVTRLHWPLKTNPSATLTWFKDKKPLETIHMEVGKAYALDVSVPHKVTNSSTEPRIHLLANLDLPFAEALRRAAEGSLLTSIS